MTFWEILTLCLLGIAIIIGIVIACIHSARKKKEELEWLENSKKSALIQYELYNRHLKTKQGEKQPPNPALSFFPDLFSRLSYLEKYGSHKHIDFILFALFKARLCAMQCIAKKQNLSIQEQTEILEAYDMNMYLSFGFWMDNNTPAFEEKSNIAITRMTAYDQIMDRFEGTFFCMSYISCALYWFLSNGWIARVNGMLSTKPRSDFSISCLNKFDKDFEHQYAPVVDELDFIVLNYCDMNIPKYINYLTNEIF